MSPRILVTGATGQVGWQLLRTIAPLGEVIAWARSQVNFAEPEQVASAVRQAAPDVVVNAAAYTAVDKAESEPELATAVNAVTPGRIAELLTRSGGLLIHYSTDYVFDGRKASPYLEEDATGPLNVYGTTKLAGEQNIAASGCRYLILRTSWVYDIRGRNFLRTVLRMAREKTALRMVADQHGAPTWARAIAEATAHIAAKSLAAGPNSPSGTYHLSAAGQTSWAGFAEQILEEYEALAVWPAGTGEWGAPLLAKCVVPILTSEYPTPARRPANSLLSNEKLAKTFGLSLPDWHDQLRLALQDAVR